MRQALNFNWSFTPNFKSEYVNNISSNALLVDIPHNMVDFPFNYFDEKSFDSVGTYSKEVILEKLNKENQYILRFEGVNNHFNLYINGQEVGYFNRPYMEENIDISNFLKKGNNLIVVKVMGDENVNAPPFGNTVDYFPFSGIYREVSLHMYEATELIDVRINATASGVVSVLPHLRNIHETNYELTYEVFDGNSLIYTSDEQTFALKNIRLWSVNDPYLYYLRATLKVGSNTKYYGYTFGFRDIEFTSTSFKLNGQPLPLIGLNRHETFPYIGGAATSYLQFNDVVALKELGVNYVRCSHYPPSRHFLDACDYLGLLVINEVPGWQHIGDDKWQEKHLENIETMIVRDYNHPSIIAWSIRINESIDHPMYEKGHNLAKKLDPYRPTTGTRNFENSNLFEDIYSYNDFSHDGTNKGLLPKRKITKTNKPYIVSENNGHMYPVKPSDNPLILESHAKRHLAVLDAFFKDHNIIGISPWCMHDYYTHKEFGSGDKICYHGVLDSFRKPKPAAYVYSTNFTSTPQIFPLYKGDNGDLPESRLYKTMVLSNVHYLSLFKKDKLVKTYYPDTKLYPHLPHPPFILDTFIGENFETSLNLHAKDRKKIAKLLNFAALNNFNRLKITQKLSLLHLMIKYRIKREHLVELWSRNIAGWGDKDSGYTLVGYDENGTELTRTTIGQTTAITYNLVLTKDQLINGETYDMTTIEIESISPYRNTYDNSPVTITYDGPILLMGPTVQALHAGCLTLYFRSIKSTGRATITISVNNTTKSFNIDVK